MTPKSIPEGKIIEGDCLEVMKGFADNQFDLVLTDPPYGIGIGKMSFVKNRVGGVAVRTDYSGQGEWDNQTPSQELFNELRRVSRNQIIFGGQYFTDKLPQSNSWLVWDKKVEDKYSNDFADVELMWTSFTKPPKIYRYLWHGMIQHNMKFKEQREHPTQKPVGLLKRLLRDFTAYTDTILDPFAGSGSTLRAAKDLNRQCTVIEINPKYIEIIKKRERQEVLL